MIDATRCAILERLRAQVRAIEVRLDDPTDSAAFHRRLLPLSLGVETLDAALGGGLAPGLHEVRPQSYFDAPAAAAACAGVTARAAALRPGPVLWVRARAQASAFAAHDFGAPDPMGLAAWGLDPTRIVLVEAADARGVLWAMEQGARTRGLACVLGEIGAASAFDRVAAQRLQRAAWRSEGVVVALRGAQGHAPSPAQTRWAVAAAPGGAVAWRGAGAAPGLGRARMRLTLERAAGAQAALIASADASLTTFTVEWDDAAHSFRLAADMADRPARPDRGRVLPLRRAG